jgi:hypothetical protein
VVWPVEFDAGKAEAAFRMARMSSAFSRFKRFRSADSSVRTPGHALRVKCADQPEEAAKFGRKLADAGVNIDGLLEVSICQRGVIFAIAVDKPEDARAPLGDQTVG